MIGTVCVKCSMVQIHPAVVVKPRKGVMLKALCVHTKGAKHRLSAKWLRGRYHIFHTGAQCKRCKCTSYN